MEGEGRGGRKRSNAAILKNALAYEQSLRLIQRSGVERKAISTSFKPGTCVAEEMLRKFYWNRAWAIRPSKYNLRSSSGSHFRGICMGEKYATFKVKLKTSIIRNRWDLSKQSGKSRVRIIENMNINETIMLKIGNKEKKFHCELAPLAFLLFTNKKRHCFKCSCIYSTLKCSSILVCFNELQRDRILQSPSFVEAALFG